ncbi:MAG: Rieske (2Fe-2S) protein [Calditrichaeota bacterium]|nr:Rieske (2Fe-2S) protein [Calditrichota bacterium]
MSVKRRKFLDYILSLGFTGLVGSIIYPALSYLKPPKQAEAAVNSVKAGKVNEIPVNSGKIVRFGRKPVILIRTSTDEFIAFTATCTHLGCIVQYREDKQQIWCACHNGLFDLKGRNISGPPPRPLDPFLVQIIDDEIIIAKPKRMS